jgi:hypothetical protein
MKNAFRDENTTKGTKGTKEKGSEIRSICCSFVPFAPFVVLFDI